MVVPIVAFVIVNFFSLFFHISFEDGITSLMSHNAVFNLKQFSCISLNLICFFLGTIAP